VVSPLLIPHEDNAMASLYDIMTIAGAGCSLTRSAWPHQPYIANVDTPGYTRRRRSSAPTPNQRIYSTRNYDIGTGVRIEDVSVSTAHEEGVLLDATSDDPFTTPWPTTSQLEALVQGNGEASIATALQDFWQAWHGRGEQRGQPGHAQRLLDSAGALTQHVRALAATWTDSTSIPAARLPMRRRHPELVDRGPTAWLPRSA